MSSRYDDFKRLQVERRDREKDAHKLGSLFGNAMLAYFASAPRNRLFEKDSPEAWPDEWVRTELFGFLEALLGNDKKERIESFGKGDFPKPRTFSGNGHDHEAT